MYVTLDELKKINAVQLDIFKKTVHVCEQLGIKWFMVHGSLLGTVRNAGFELFDDDIDIAMARGDYERFLKEAPALMDEHLFVQSYLSDPQYPLLFAKVRDSRTTYICDAMKKIKMNHGIFIDVFPLDNTLEDNKLKKFLVRLFSLRISASLCMGERTLAQKIKRLLSFLLCPSVRFAVRQSDKLLKAAPVSGKVDMTGGKTVETAIPAAWFESAEEMLFEGIKVYVPKEYDRNLRLIYGDYETCVLAEEKMDGEKVHLNACIMNVEKPYTFYMEKAGE